MPCDSYNGILFSNLKKKEEIIDAYENRDESQKLYVEQNTPDIKEYV